MSEGECLHRSNKLLYQSTSPEKFATLFYSILDTGDHSLTFANAGHDNPFVMNRGVQKARLKAGGIPLGMMEEFSFEHDSVPLAPGDTIVMYSDGIPEAMNEQRDFFGEEQLAALLAKHHLLTLSRMMEKIVEIGQERNIRIIPVNLKKYRLELSPFSNQFRC